MKASIFDLDGTLIDSMWIWKDLASKYLKTIGVEAPDDLRESIKRYSLLEACHYLKDRLAIATLKRLEIDHYFEFVQTCNSTGLQKGDSRFFEIAVDKLNEKPEDVWVFEDAYHCMESAKRINLNVVGIEDESAKEDRDKIRQVAHVYIRNFEELDIDRLFLK